MNSAGRASRFEGWQATALVAVTYVYFLIFAQFGFLKRLNELTLAQAHLKTVMGAMAFGGILGSVLSPRPLRDAPGHKLRIGLGGCALAAALSVLPLTSLSAALDAALIGLSLGVLTVTLVANLPLWAGTTSPLWKIGCGTGIGYAICNVPALFKASPATTAWTAASLCVAALIIPQVRGGQAPAAADTPQVDVPFALVLACFTALVWFDSAAFYIIQNSAVLKAGTWSGNLHLWRNAALHFSAALASVLLLRRRGLIPTLAAAFGLLATACLLLQPPMRVLLASWLYPVGVSLYSVALVATPSYLLADRSPRSRAHKAGLLYAISGWCGSALGIGMAQNLHHVPTLFIAVAGALVASAVLLHLGREGRLAVLSIAAVFGLSALIYRALPAQPQPSYAQQVQYGREVYIAEGCIHCHSQYVRPHSPDVMLWGPTETLEAVRQQKPPLIGNRRQGPDLSEVGSRRSPLWLRIHFDQPDAVSYHSVMPSYRYLFSDARGNALVAYLSSLRTPGVAAHRQQEVTAWAPVSTAGHPSASGYVLFDRYCATCHSTTGIVRQRWGRSFTVSPPNLAAINLTALPSSLPGEPYEHRLERIIKFGIPGTDMPGHEYLSDADVLELSRYVNQLHSTPERAH